MASTQTNNKGTTDPVEAQSQAGAKTASSGDHVEPQPDRDQHVVPAHAPLRPAEAQAERLDEREHDEQDKDAALPCPAPE